MTRSHRASNEATALLLLVVPLCFFPNGAVAAFSARLERPWEVPIVSRRQHRLRLFVAQVPQSLGDEQRPNGKETDTKPLASSSTDDDHAVLPILEQRNQETSDSKPPAITTPYKAVDKEMKSTTNVISATKEDQTKEPVSKYTSKLWEMSRPANLPGVVVFYLLGTHLAISSSSSVALSKLLWNLRMIATLLSLVLVTTTSMLVNDYYDVKLGRDKPSESLVPQPVIRRCLEYLYAIALLNTTLVPGIPARLAVISGLIMTFVYTQYLKPKTWIKNFVCAGLIALAPFTSGVAALATRASGAVMTSNPIDLFRLTALLLFGIVGREITMDLNDVDADREAEVLTVPVVHGREFGATVALGCSLVTLSLAVGGPLGKLVASEANVTFGVWRRLALACVGGLAQARRAWQVFQTKGEDTELNGKVIDEGLLTVVLLMASFA